MYLKYNDKILFIETKIFGHLYFILNLFSYIIFKSFKDKIKFIPINDVGLRNLAKLRTDSINRRRNLIFIWIYIYCNPHLNLFNVIFRPIFHRMLKFLIEKNKLIYISFISMLTLLRLNVQELIWHLRNIPLIKALVFCIKFWCNVDHNAKVLI